MRPRRLLGPILILVLAVPAFSQGTANDEKAANIRRLLTLTGAEKLQQGILDQFMAIFKAGLNKGPKLDEQRQKVLDRMSELLTEEMKKANFTQMAVELYDKYYTNEEIKLLIQFYQSPVGQKTIRVLPTLSQESMERGAKLGELAASRALSRLGEEYPEIKSFLNPSGK